MHINYLLGAVPGVKSREEWRELLITKVAAFMICKAAYTDRAKVIKSIVCFSYSRLRVWQWHGSIEREALRIRSMQGREILV
jgi:hypothetical protein